jgi:hypothetical protein
METLRRNLPQLGGDFFLTDGGIETTLTAQTCLKEIGL